MNKKEIKAIDELTKINIELKQKNQEQQRVLDKIKEYIPKLRRTPSYELDEKLDDILELLEGIE